MDYKVVTCHLKDSDATITELKADGWTPMSIAVTAFHAFGEQLYILASKS